jgi:hypothetical protein
MDFKDDTLKYLTMESCFYSRSRKKCYKELPHEFFDDSVDGKPRK